MEWLNYLLKVSVCLTLFYFFYLVGLRKLTFFKVNRAYLLIGIISSFVIPTLKFTVEREVLQLPVINQSMPAEQIPYVQAGGSVNVAGGAIYVAPEPLFDWYQLLPWSYLTIVFVLFAVAFWRILQLVRHVKSGSKQLNGLKLVSKTTGFTNCSFFSYVFIDDDHLSPSELEILIKHEQVHAKQLHSVDKIIMLVAKSILWFNPIIYLYDKVLEQNHEYEADEATSENYGINPYAELLLRLAVANSDNALVHNFVKSPIKERIKMLFHDKSKKMKKLIYLLILPVGLGLIWGFTVDVVEVFPKITVGQEVQEQPFVVVIDAGHGGKNNGAQQQNVNEKDITLSMANRIKALAQAEGIKVVLTRNDDTYVALSDRTKVPGSLLLSLHVNNEPTKKRSGIEMYTSGNYSETDHKLAKSNGFTYYLYKSLSQQKEIKVNSRPMNKRLLILNQSAMPSVMLEMGYLSHPSDFRYITNLAKQDELAALIVKAIKAYKKGVHEVKPDSGSMKAHMADFRIKYAAWLKSDLRAQLIKSAKTFKSQRIKGTIESLNYFRNGGNPKLDGFILRSGDIRYRIYLDKDQLKDMVLNVGDEVSFYAAKTEVWYDSPYLVVQPSKVTVAQQASASNNILKWSASVSSLIDSKNETMMLKKGKMEIEGLILEGDELIYDKKMGIITVKNGSLTEINGHQIKAGLLIYDLKSKTFKSQNTVGTVSPKESPAYDLLSTLKANGDSVRTKKIMDRTLLVMGKPKLQFDEYEMAGKVLRADMNSSKLVAYYGTLKTPNGYLYNAEVIEFDLLSKEVRTSTYNNYTKEPEFIKHN